MSNNTTPSGRIDGSEPSPKGAECQAGQRSYEMAASGAVIVSLREGRPWVGGESTGQRALGGERELPSAPSTQLLGQALPTGGFHQSDPRAFVVRQQLLNQSVFVVFRLHFGPSASEEQTLHEFRVGPSGAFSLVAHAPLPGMRVSGEFDSGTYLRDSERRVRHPSCTPEAGCRTLGGLIQVGRRIHNSVRSALELGPLCFERSGLRITRPRAGKSTATCTDRLATAVSSRPRPVVNSRMISSIGLLSSKRSKNWALNCSATLDGDEHSECNHRRPGTEPARRPKIGDWPPEATNHSRTTPSYLELSNIARPRTEMLDTVTCRRTVFTASNAVV